MKLLLIFILCFGFYSSVSSQAIEERIRFFEKSVGNDIVVTSDGGMVIVGEDYDTDQGKKGGLIFKVDAEGELVWKFLLHQEAGTMTYFSRLIQTADGDFVALGSSIKYNTPDPGNVTSTVVMKISAAGTELWTKSFANPGAPLWNTLICSHLQPYTDGGVIVSLNVSSLHCGGAALLRLDDDGNLVWARAYHSASDARDILVMPTGEVYFTGTMVEDGIYSAYLTQINPTNGLEIFSKVYAYADGSAYGRELVYDNTNIYLAGNYDGQLFLIKLSNDGLYSVEWSIAMADHMDIPLDAEIVNDQIMLVGVQYDIGQISLAVQIDFDGNKLDDYTFSNVDGALGVYALCDAGAGQVAVVGKFEEYGTAFSSVYMGKSPLPLASYCAFTNVNVAVESVEVLVSIPDFNTGESPIERPFSMLKSQLNREEIDSYCSLTEIKESSDVNLVIHLYPNPVSTLLQIESDQLISMVKIYDALGKIVEVYAEIDAVTNVQLGVANLSTGFYMIEVTTDQGQINQRFFKQ